MYRAMEEMFNQNSSQLSFEEIYRTAYSLVLAKHGQLLFDGCMNQIRNFLQREALRIINSGVFINAESNPVSFLQELTESYFRCYKILKMIQHVLMYLDRIWVNRQYNTTLDQILLEMYFDITLTKDTIRPKLTECILSLIQRGRVGEFIEGQEVIRKCCQMLIELSSSVSMTVAAAAAAIEPSTTTTTTTNNNTITPSNHNGNVYEILFEQPFLIKSEQYFYQISREYLDSNTVPMYVNWVTEFIATEHKRCNELFHGQTWLKLHRVAEKELCLAHMDALISAQESGLYSMLLAGKEQEITELANLLKSSDVAMNKIAHVVKTCIIDCANSIFGEDPTHVTNIQVINQLIKLKLKYDDLVTRALGKDKLFAKTLKSAWEHVMNYGDEVGNHHHQLTNTNTNTNTTTTTTSAVVSIAPPPSITEVIWVARLLVLHLDDGLKTGFKNSTLNVGPDVEIDYAVSLFRYLTNKDVFESFYRIQLAKRLLGGKSHSDDLELSVISKIKLECGSQFTNKLEGMFKDHKQSSKEHEYRVQATTTTTSSSSSTTTSLVIPETTLTFRPIILTSVHWPERDVGLIITESDRLVRLPMELKSSLAIFEQSYLTHYRERRISWLFHSYGTCDVKASGFTGEVKSYDLTLSIYQTCVLLLFQQRGVRELTFKQIADETLIPVEELRRHLISMAIKPSSSSSVTSTSTGNTMNYQILIKSGDKKVFLDHDVWTFNHDYRCKFRKIRIPLVSASANFKTNDGSSNSGELGGTVVVVDGGIPSSLVEERKHMIDAAIVRVMKSRKTLDHVTLVAELLRQLRFKPSLPDVKKRIESLIEREYLTRDEHDSKMYVYLA
jgi:cullin 3